MRLGFIALVGVLTSFSPPPCQKTNSEFMREDAGGTDSASETGIDESTSTGTSTSATATASAGTTTAPESTTTMESGGAGTTSDGEETSMSETAASESTGGGVCPAPEELCGGVCTDTTSNPDHCGMCNLKCHPAMETCENSTCVPN